MGSKGKEEARSREQDGASQGKIFIGGLPRDTTTTIFLKHFAKYGEIIDSVIMKDKYTSQPRGFGFITYANPAVVDKVIEDTHVINGKQVEIKRTIPKGSTQSKDFKTKKIFVGGIPSTLTEDEFKNFFSKYGNVVDHQIIRDHGTNRSRGFGFIVFDSEEVVDDLLAKGNMIYLAGSQVEIKKAAPKKSSNPPPSSYGSESRGRSFGDDFGGFGSSYSSFGGDGFGPYRNHGGIGGRFGAYGAYGGVGEYGGGYGRFGAGLGGYGGESSLGYASRFGSYGTGFGGGYAGALGGFGRVDESFGAGYGSSSYGGGYDSAALGGGYGTGGGLYGSRGGFTSGAGRYHPYTR